MPQDASSDNYCHFLASATSPTNNLERCFYISISVSDHKLYREFNFLSDSSSVFNVVRFLVSLIKVQAFAQRGFHYGLRWHGEGGGIIAMLEEMESSDAHN